MGNKLPIGDFHASEIPFVFNNLLNIVRMFPLHGNVSKMADTISCTWASFAYSGSPNGGIDGPPDCENVHGKIDVWPRFQSDRLYYSLNDGVFARPRSVALQPDNTYPHDEYPSDQRCDMWSAVKFPWRNRSEL